MNSILVSFFCGHWS